MRQLRRRSFVLSVCENDVFWSAPQALGPGAEVSPADGPAVLAVSETVVLSNLDVINPTDERNALLDSEDMS